MNYQESFEVLAFAVGAKAPQGIEMALFVDILKSSGIDPNQLKLCAKHAIMHPRDAFIPGVFPSPVEIGRINDRRKDQARKELERESLYVAIAIRDRDYKALEGYDLKDLKRIYDSRGGGFDVLHTKIMSYLIDPTCIDEIAPLQLGAKKVEPANEDDKEHFKRLFMIA